MDLLCIAQNMTKFLSSSIVEHDLLIDHELLLIIPPLEGQTN